MKNEYYELNISYIEDIDLSDKTIKEFFEFDENYEVTKEDREMYLEDYFIPSFVKEHNLDIKNIYEYTFTHSYD